MGDNGNKNFSSSQKFALVMLSANQFMFTCALSMIAPIYPREISERGGNEVIAGLMFSFYALLLFFSAPIFGRISPKLGLKTTFTLGLIASGIGNILFGTLHHVKEKYTFIALSFTFRAIESIGATAFISTGNVVISEIFPNNVGFVRGVCEIFISLGYSLGPAIGGLLYSFGGFQLPFTLLGVVMIMVTPLNRRIIPTEKITEEETKSGLMQKLLIIPTILLTSAILISTALTWSFLEPTLEPHLRKYELSLETIGFIFLIYPATFGLSGPLAGWVSDKKPKYKWHVMVLGLMVMTFSLLGLGPTTIQSFFKESLLSNLIALGVLGVGTGCAFIPTYQCLTEGAIEGGLKDDVSTQSVVSAIWVSSYSLGNMIGPVTAGVLYTNWGFAVMTHLLACLSFIIGFVIILYRVFLDDKRVEASSDHSQKPNEKDVNEVLLST